MRYGEYWIVWRTLPASTPGRTTRLRPQRRGDPPGQIARVEAAIDPFALGSDADDGTLTIRWYAGETVDARPEFAFHYSDTSGFDCGWHHEPNPHVDGWAHYQERSTETDGYDHESVTFGGPHPVPLFWEVLDRLETGLILSDRTV